MQTRNYIRMSVVACALMTLDFTLEFLCNILSKYTHSTSAHSHERRVFYVACNPGGFKHSMPHSNNGNHSHSGPGCLPGNEQPSCLQIQQQKPKIKSNESKPSSFNYATCVLEGNLRRQVKAMTLQ